jgi:hypothetical protein
MFVGSSNELGAFESGVTAKLMASYCSCFWRKHDAYCLTTGIVSPFRKIRSY